jgi:RNase P protein component
MHSQRLSRQFERTVNQLREIQKTRRDQQAQAMNQALDLLETAEKNGESHDPFTDGFVFSKPEIDLALHRRHRARRAPKASCALLMQAA